MKDWRWIGAAVVIGAIAVISGLLTLLLQMVAVIAFLGALFLLGPMLYDFVRTVFQKPAYLLRGDMWAEWGIEAAKAVGLILAAVTIAGVVSFMPAAPSLDFLKSDKCYVDGRGHMEPC